MSAQARTAAALDAIHRHLAAQDLQAAMAQAEAALRAGLRAPLLFNLAAHRHQTAGRLETAIGLIEAGLQIAPDDVFLVCALAGALSQQGRDTEALALYEQAARLAPGHAPAHHGRGLSLQALGDGDAAKAAHARAIQLAPDYPDALAALAAAALQDGDRDGALDLASKALAHDAEQPAAIAVMAQLELGGGDAVSALTRLQARLSRGGLAPLHLSALAGLEAEALERLDAPEAALAAHMRSKAAAWNVHAGPLAASGVELGPDMCRRLRSRFEGEAVERWRGAPGEPVGDAPALHVFLVGFVRSGTTLLEQVLASHPEVVALEEQPLLRSFSKAWLGDDAAIARLRDLDEVQARTLRRDYWAKVRACGVEPAGRTFVDKNPLDVIFLPLAAKLFPQARIVIARRDPRDVVVSAFRHRFMVNALTCAFNDLETTARYYADLQALQQTYLQRLPLAAHVVRNEDLVADFDGEARRLCDFVGLGWTDALRDFATTAKRRDIRTPSAEQVRRGLSREGVGRWRRYGAGLAPILPILAPWATAYGYGA